MDNFTCHTYYNCAIVILVILIIIAVIYLIYVNYEGFLDIQEDQYEGSNYHNDNYINEWNYPKFNNYMRYKMKYVKW